jgi:diaminopimelate decarboxylase
MQLGLVMAQPRFITPKLAAKIHEQFSAPAYVYDEKTLKENAAAVLDFPNAYGLTARYAMKASSNAAILQIFDAAGLHIDASSGHEIERALRAGVAPEKISLSTQEFSDDFADYYEKGVSINACSLRQIERFGEAFPGRELGLRFNPGVGSGGTQKTNVGGPSSSFGIWHGKLDEVKALVAKYDLKIFRIHTHIGSGSDPDVWQKASALSINMVREFPSATRLNLGGGYKVGRMPYEKTTDLQAVATPVKKAFADLASETGREIHLEIEPGTWLLANAGSILASIQDVTDTGEGGYSFLKLDTGMTEILRPSLYAAQQPFFILPQGREPCEATREYIIVGHCCESGDLLTPSEENSETLAPRKLPEAAIGDLCVIDGTGAYCAAMSAKNYNSFPEAPEVMIRENGDLRLIRQRQTLDQILQNELPLAP